jgi:hypothetical protein
MWHRLSLKVDTYFADNRRSLGRTKTMELVCVVCLFGKHGVQCFTSFGKATLGNDPLGIPNSS